MLPQYIYPRLMEQGINAFAVCDHNSTRNIRAFYEFGKKWFPHILFLPGIEIETVEELHILGIFANIDDAEKAGERIRETLKKDIKRPDFLEPQYIINSQGEIIGEEEIPLHLSSGLDLEEAVQLLRKYDVIVIASHVDRPSFSVTSQLGFIPDNVFDALEISPISVKRVIEKREFVLRNITYTIPEDVSVITSTDAHSIEEIGQVRTRMDRNELTFDSIKKGIKEQIILEVNEVD